MKNSVNREIPDYLLKDGNEIFKGAYANDGKEIVRDTPTIKSNIKPRDTKLVENLKEAIKKTGLKDGDTISFHHHFRDGDFVAAMVMDAIHELGIKDLFICASSLGKAHRNFVPMIEDGTITGVSTSGVRDEIGEAISEGKLKNPAYIRSHGGRVGAIESGKVKIDVAFIGASSSDEYGNASGINGKANCGVLSYAGVDAKYADKVVVITDTLVDFPNYPHPISSVDVDYVVKVDKIGDPAKIASGAIRMTKDPRELKMAEYCAKVIANTEWFKDGFSFQTGAGGASLAAAVKIKPYLEKSGIKMGWAMGGITEPIVNLLREGYVKYLADDQAFDVASVESVYKDPAHFEIDSSEYANPLNKGAYVNKLDYVVLGALEIDKDFNVNVVVGSDGTIQGAPGGHPDTAAGANCSIIVAPLVRGRIATVREKCTSITTPGETVDVLVTDYGVCVNPKRKDILDQLKDTDLPLVSIEDLVKRGEEITGTPDDIEYDDQVVAIIEYRDGSIIDVVRKVK